MKKYYTLLLLAITAPFYMHASQKTENNETMEVSYSTSTKGVEKMPFWLTLGSLFTLSSVGSTLAIFIYLRTDWRARHYNQKGFEKQNRKNLFVLNDEYHDSEDDDEAHGLIS